MWFVDLISTGICPQSNIHKLQQLLKKDRSCPLGALTLLVFPQVRTNGTDAICGAANKEVALNLWLQW